MPTETNVVERLMSDAPEKPLIGPAFRRMQFAETYIRSGAQLKIAADAHGYDHGTARHLVRNPEVRSYIGARAQEVAEQEHISTRAWAENLAAIAYMDVADLYNEDGTLVETHKLPRRVTKAISKIRVVERKTDAGVVERVTEITFFDKNAALTTIAKHLGLFERDNKQKAESLQLVVNFVESSSMLASAEAPLLRGQQRVAARRYLRRLESQSAKGCTDR